MTRLANSDIEISKVLVYLKDVIDNEGISYLCREPYTIYERLLEQGIDPRLCRAVLSSLLTGIPETIRKRHADGKKPMRGRQGKKVA